MRKIRALIGLPVIVNGHRTGRVVQAELSCDLMQLDGLWVAAGFFGTRFIPSENIGTIGSVCVIADHSGIKKRCKTTSLLRRAISTDGKRLGAIIGAEIDELSFCVCALELSGGVWDDLLAGRRNIRRFALNQETGDVVVDVSESERR